MEMFLADDKDVREGEAKEVDFAGRPAIIIRYNGKLHAYINCCTHTGGPVKLQGDRLVCQWHNSHFQPDNGKALTRPAALNSRLISLPIKIKDGKIFYVYP